MILFRPVMIDKNKEHATFFDATASFDKAVSLARTIHSNNLNYDVFVWLEIWPTLNHYFYYYYILTGNSHGFGTVFSLKYQHNMQSSKSIWKSDEKDFLSNKDTYKNIQTSKKPYLFIIIIISIMISFLFYEHFYYKKDDKLDTNNKIDRDKAFALADKLENSTPKKSYIYPNKAPNGEDWPKNAGYISGYIKANNNGLSKLTINNSQNSSDIFVKLCDISIIPPNKVRHIFIPAGKKLTITNISSGIYDVRYKNLNTDENAKSESFYLQETNTIDGINYSVVEMTIYKVLNGNMQMTPIPESDF